MYSVNDRSYFREMPIVEECEDRLKLKWIFGEFGFYFSPSCKNLDKKLYCMVSGTTSTGDSTGKTGTVLITDYKEVRAGKRYSVHWIEPDGQVIKLKMVDGGKSCNSNSEEQKGKEE